MSTGEALSPISLIQISFKVLFSVTKLKETFLLDGTSYMDFKQRCI